MDEQEMGGGFSPKKVVAGAALGVAVPAAVAVAKKLVGGSDDGESDGDDARERDDGARDEPISRERKQTTRRSPAKAKSATSRKKQTAGSRAKRTTGSPASRTKNRTREQLYKQATRLKIDGRSSMNKAQLERAVDRAKQKAKAG
jgi:hypothetical protein